jgi:hypothetical protein
MDEQKSPNLPNPLTLAQMEAVRFQITKPGYSFEQVEAFINKAKQTLKFIQMEMRKDKLALAEGQDEIELLSERSQTLSATLEIFKVKGDAIVSADGEYLTESKVKSTKLFEENSNLKEQLQLAQEDANAGWEAEAELRKYIEQNLLPWLEQHKEAIVSSEELKLKDGEENKASDPNTAKEEDEESNYPDEKGSEEHVGDVSPTNIIYEEEITYVQHVETSSDSNPLLGSEQESDWFK